CLCFFFFSSRRRHTRFSRDWSSDVCSSDLPCGRILSAGLRMMNDFITFINDIPFAVTNNISISVLQTCLLYGFVITVAIWLVKRSEERRVGKEGRSGWWEYHYEEEQCEVM